MFNGAALLVVKIQRAYQDHKKTQEILFQIWDWFIWDNACNLQ